MGEFDAEHKLVEMGRRRQAIIDATVKLSRTPAGVVPPPPNVVAEMEQMVAGMRAGGMTDLQIGAWILVYLAGIYKGHPALNSTHALFLITLALARDIR